ncbi:MAG: SMP-30/gluconolactonase/LRE family protein, partial [Chloroflexia bacterium]|nr:SMP-30/gluconolactonase/LRE family protein [Chloroflexia bacterium]
MATRDDDLYVSRMLTAPGLFTAGVEGPACDAEGNIYAVNFGREGTIGRVTPAGEGGVWLELPLGSIGNGIRFDRGGDMLIADYTNHNILRVDMETSTVSVYAHEPALNQPNDLT